MAMGFVHSAPLQRPRRIHTPSSAPVGDLLRRLQTLSRFLPFSENDPDRLVSGLIFKTDPSSSPHPFELSRAVMGNFPLISSF